MWMRTYILWVLVIFHGFGIADPNPFPCKTITDAVVREYKPKCPAYNLGKLVREIYFSKGKRIFLRPTEPDFTPAPKYWEIEEDEQGLILEEKNLPPKPLYRGWNFLTLHNEPEWRWYSYFNYINPLYHIGTLRREIVRRTIKDSYDVDLLYGLYHNFVKRPVRAATSDGRGKSKEPTKFVGFALLMLAGGLTYHYGNEPFWDWVGTIVIDKKILMAIEKDKDYLDELIENDRRFVAIRKALAEGRISLQKARILAYKMQKILNGLNLSLGFGLGVENDETLVATYLDDPAYEPVFGSFKEFIKKGVTARPDFIIPPEAMGPLSREKIAALLRNELALHQDFYSAEMVIHEDKKRLEASKKDEAMQAHIQELVVDEPYRFIPFLFKTRDEGLINDSQLFYRVHEWLEWKAKFDRWKIMGVKKRKEIAPEVYSDEELTPKDIMDSITEEIADFVRSRAAQR